jgi:hypothetical protein
MSVCLWDPTDVRAIFVGHKIWNTVPLLHFRTELQSIFDFASRAKPVNYNIVHSYVRLTFVERLVPQIEGHVNFLALEKGRPTIRAPCNMGSFGWTSECLRVRTQYYSVLYSIPVKLTVYGELGLQLLQRIRVRLSFFSY